MGVHGADGQHESAAISALVSPAASRRRTSTCRPVRPAGLSRVDAAGPRGMRATPRSRSRSRSDPGERRRPEAVRMTAPPALGRMRAVRQRERVFEGQPARSQAAAAGAPAAGGQVGVRVVDLVERHVVAGVPIQKATSAAIDGNRVPVDSSYQGRTRAAAAARADGDRSARPPQEDGPCTERSGGPRAGGSASVNASRQPAHPRVVTPTDPRPPMMPERRGCGSCGRRPGPRPASRSASAHRPAAASPCPGQ